jgi:hypothetical protein
VLGVGAVRAQHRQQRIVLAADDRPEHAEATDLPGQKLAHAERDRRLAGRLLGTDDVDPACHQSGTVDVMACPAA